MATFTVTRNLVQQRYTASTIARRFVTTRAFVPVEVEHYTSGWKTFGDLESYSPERYQIQTFNKISPKVSSFFVDFHVKNGKGYGLMTVCSLKIEKVFTTYTPALVT